MYTYPINCSNHRIAAKGRTSRPANPQSRRRVAHDLAVAQTIARAIDDNASQLYRGA